MRIIAECCVAIHHVIFVKPGRPHAQSSFEIIFHAEHYRSDMPVVAVVILKGSAVACTARKSAGLITKRVRLRSKWPQRAVADGHSIGIAAEFGARCGVLQVVLAVVFSHM